jgi:prepilin-type N-terminal cleavage/methylation domain-containing protein
VKKQKGFSLIELIVVVTIIMVISVVGVVSFAGANKKSRDSRRQTDVEKIRIALEMIRQVGTTYPLSTASLVPNYIQTIPSGPKGDTYHYLIVSGSGNYQYTLDAQMEDLGSTNGSYEAGCGDSKPCNYRVVNP